VSVAVVFGSDAGLQEQAGPGHRISEALHEARREQAGLARALLSPLVPAVFTLAMHVDDVSHPQLQLILTVGRVRDDAPKPFSDGRHQLFALAIRAVQGVGLAMCVRLWRDCRVRHCCDCLRLAPARHTRIMQPTHASPTHNANIYCDQIQR